MVVVGGGGWKGRKCAFCFAARGFWRAVVHTAVGDPHHPQRSKRNASVTGYCVPPFVWHRDFVAARNFVPVLRPTYRCVGVSRSNARRGLLLGFVCCWFLRSSEFLLTILHVGDVWYLRAKRTHVYTLPRPGPVLPKVQQCTSLIIRKKKGGHQLRF